MPGAREHIDFIPYPQVNPFVIEPMQFNGFLHARASSRDSAIDGVRQEQLNNKYPENMPHNDSANLFPFGTAWLRAGEAQIHSFDAATPLVLFNGSWSGFSVPASQWLTTCP